MRILSFFRVWLLLSSCVLFLSCNKEKKPGGGGGGGPANLAPPTRVDARLGEIVLNYAGKTHTIQSTHPIVDGDTIPPEAWGYYMLNTKSCEAGTHLYEAVRVEGNWLEEYDYFPQTAGIWVGRCAKEANMSNLLIDENNAFWIDWEVGSVYAYFFYEEILPNGEYLSLEAPPYDSYGKDTTFTFRIVSASPNEIAGTFAGYAEEWKESDETYTENLVWITGSFRLPLIQIAEGAFPYYPYKTKKQPHSKRSKRESLKDRLCNSRKHAD